jgi:hypothetical protein
MINYVVYYVCMIDLQVTNILKVHKDQQMPQMLPCGVDNPFQKWRWTYKFEFNYNWEKPANQQL